MVHDPSRWQSSAPIRYPDPDIVVLDTRFQHMVLAWPRSSASPRVSASPKGRSGYGDGRYLLFSRHPQRHAGALGRAHRRARILRHPSDYPDGNTRDRQGRLITCELAPHADPHRT